MHLEPDDLLLMGALIAAGLFVVCILRASGRLDRDSLANVPHRDLDLGAGDMVIAAVLYVFGSAMAVELAAWTGIDFNESDPLRYATFALLAQVVSQGPLAGFFVFRTRKIRPRFISAPWFMLAALSALLAALPLVLALNVTVVRFAELLGFPEPESGHRMLIMLRDSQSVPATMLLVLAAVVFAPLLEEIIFRGIVQSSLLSVLGPERRWTAIICAAVLFTIVHMSIAAWQTLPGLFALALILGWLYEKHGSLVPSILTHTGFNAVMICLTFVIKA